MASSKKTHNFSAEYDKENYDRITIRVSKGRKDILEVHAVNHGESLNRFINRAIDNQLMRDKPIRRGL